MGGIEWEEEVGRGDDSIKIGGGEGVGHQEILVQVEWLKYFSFYLSFFLSFFLSFSLHRPLWTI